MCGTLSDYISWPIINARMEHCIGFFLLTMALQHLSPGFFTLIPLNRNRWECFVCRRTLNVPVTILPCHGYQFLVFKYAHSVWNSRGGTQYSFVRGDTEPKFKSTLTLKTLILPKWYPFHILRTNIAPFLYLKNKPKVVDHRGILAARRFQASVIIFCVVIFSAKISLRGQLV